MAGCAGCKGTGVNMAGCAGCKGTGVNMAGTLGASLASGAKAAALLCDCFSDGGGGGGGGGTTAAACILGGGAGAGAATGGGAGTGSLSHRDCRGLPLSPEGRSDKRDSEAPGLRSSWPDLPDRAGLECLRLGFSSERRPPRLRSLDSSELSERRLLRPSLLRLELRGLGLRRRSLSLSRWGLRLRRLTASCLRLR